MSNQIPNLHDAVLESVGVDLENGAADLSIGLVGSSARSAILRCSSFRRLVIDRDEPWGPSVHINRVFGGDERLDIEMQTGDHIVIYGEEMKVIFSASD